jgi:integrase
LFVVLLETGMRISETLHVTMDQFDAKYFRNVKRKGRRRDHVYPSPEARAALKDRFDNKRGRGPVFQSRNGTLMLRKHADCYLKQIGAMANANVPVDENVNLRAHLMRQAALIQAEQKFGRPFAQKKSGSVGIEHIERYVEPAHSDYKEAMYMLFS